MSKEIRIGLLAIVAILLMLWGYRYLLGTNLLVRSQVFYVRYDNIDYLQVADPVIINGAKIGNVKEIAIDPTDLQTIRVALNVDRNVKLPRSTVAELHSSSPMGGKAIRLTYNEVCREDCLPSGSEIRGVTLSLLGSLVQTDEIELYMQTLRDGISGVVDTINRTIDGRPEEGIGKVFHDLSVTVLQLRQTTALMNKLFYDASGKMVGMLDNLQAVSGTIRHHNEDIGAMITNINTITHQLASARLDSTIRTATNTLGTTGQSMQNSLSQMDSLLNQLQTTMSDINRGSGTLGKLAKDEAAYDNLSGMLRQLELLMQDVRLNPKRYVNVSVFGKKQTDYQLPDNDPADTAAIRQ